MSIKLASLVGLSLVAGCVIDDELPATGEIEQQAGGCPIWECGTNSPVVEAMGLQDIDILSGQVNATGFKYVDFRKGAPPMLTIYDVQVTNGKITATPKSGVGPTLQDAALQDSYFHLFNVNNGKHYALRIAAVGSVNYWAWNGAPKTMQTYQFDYSEIVNNAPLQYRLALCPNPPRESDALGMNIFETLVFEGDKIYASSKRVDPAEHREWVNFGCAGHALAKLALTGHTRAAAIDGYVTTWQERQTMLKMITADYCGTGKPYTVAGMPLSWRDNRVPPWMWHAPTATTLEARWNENGAVCLGQMRGDAHPALVAGEFPGGMGSWVACAATKPACAGTINNLAGLHLITANKP